jgi:hypothetical protein
MVVGDQRLYRHQKHEQKRKMKINRAEHEEITVEKDHYKFTESVNIRIRYFTRLGEISTVNRGMK